MRVAIVCPYAWDRFGGVQSHVGSLAAALRARGHDAEVIAPRARKDASTEPWVTTVGRAVPIPANGSVAPLSFGPLAAAGVRRALKAFEPEVLHLHEPLIPSLSLLALWNAPCPTVGTFHASADSSIGYALGSIVLERAAARLNVRTAVSDSAKALVSRYFPGDYLLTPNGVNTASFADARSRPADGPKGILFFGRLERRKGLEVLIQSMTRLRDLDVELVVAGTGPEERAARALADRLQVGAHFLGPVEEKDKPAVFGGASAYCAPGIGGESFGIVLLEAMAAGTPVVCSDLQGFKEVAGDAARFADAGSPGALADALRAVLTDDDVAARLARNGTRRAAMFDWTRLAAGVESVYDRALSRPNGY